MKIRGSILSCLLGGVVLAMQASATNVRRDASSKVIDASNNPYDVIVRRNVFDLHEPLLNPPIEDTAPPPPNVALTGIMTILGDKRALFMVQEVTPPGKPPKSAESYILTEGQRQGVLEVLEIDAKNAKVKIKNDGIVSTITFEASKSGASGPAGRGPQRGMMGSGRPFNSFPGSRRPGFNPDFNPQSPAAPLQTGKHFPRPG